MKLSMEQGDKHKNLVDDYHLLQNENLNMQKYIEGLSY